jgi:type VI secretion system protein ImpJ
MNMNRPLFWNQGLLLQPHHFQQQDMYFQSLLDPYQRFVQPYLWGVGRLEIQESALGNRTFNLTGGEFLMPDRTHVTIPGNALVEARSFEEDWTEGEKPLTVFLGLRKYSTTGENVKVLPDLENLTEITTRFVTTSDSEETPDVHQEGPTAQVRRMYYLLKVFWDSEIDQLGDYLLIPLGQLTRSGEDITVADQFIPPSLTLSASGRLMKVVKEIRDQVAARGAQLEAYKRTRGIHTAEFGARDMVYLLALRSLNRYIPALHHMTDSGHIHPWWVYGMLRQMIGELSSFSDNVNVMGGTENQTQQLPKYKHRNLWQCFHQAQLVITRLLDEITAGPEYMIQLAYDGTYFATEMTPQMFEGRNRFYLVFETEGEPQTVITSMETIAKLSSRETLPLLIARALPGIKLEHLPQAPQELPRRANAVYFKIDHHSDQWSQIQKAKNMALYWDTAPEDLTVELMIVGRT